MKSWIRTSSMTIAIVLLLMPVAGLAADDQTKTPTAVSGAPKYKFPIRGVPGTRLGGGTRGIDQGFTLAVLAPDHTGLTTQERPILYWYLSKATSYPLVFTLVDTTGEKTIVEARLDPPAQPGVQRIRLADHGVSLSPGIQYQWFVALSLDPERRSSDIIAGGVIERIESPKDLAARLTKAGKTDALKVYAEAGIWYDAVASISEQIERSPSEKSLRQQRAALLNQVGLPEIAVYDLRDGANR
jgi:hypothetical protein